MCVGGPRAPSPPPRLPEAPRLADQSGAQMGDADARRRRRAAGESTQGTILTGSRGVDQPATGTQKTLLGA